ncbi:MAG TPA: helix-turn-helix domain-containing protein [Verrucomicrobiae bacterium]|nr:helix-turn-helix domain-containing protein [Verrucomicrobiae bacterium]
MPTVAEQLRTAREARKLTISQVADATKIRTDHLRALEDGNFNVFSAPIYIRGSVKNYAAMLKLDVPRILADLEAELKGTEKFAEPPPLMEESKTFVDHVMFWLSKVNAKAALIAGGVVAAVILVWIVIAVVRHPHNSPPPNLPPAVYQAPNSGETLPLPQK